MSGVYEPKVGETYYRFDDLPTSQSDENGEHVKTNYAASLSSFTVAKRTPCGVQLKHSFGGTRFMLDYSTRRFACPTIELALESYRARKMRQIGIYKERIKGAELMLEAAECMAARSADR